ncbi:hypothetical protein BDW75DRAFT_149584 [Aspergillus navahoensis]
MRPKSRTDFAIAIICALPLEADAVEALFDEDYDRLGKHYRKQQGDVNAYINGRIGNHNVVLCYMPGIGIRSAASVISNLRFSYTGIELALVVGICGGAPSPPDYREIFLGDVIISDSVIEYDFGRQYPCEFIRKTGIRDTLSRPIPEIEALLNGLRAAKARDELQMQVLQHLQRLQQKGPRWNHPQAKDVLFKATYLHKHYRQAHSLRCCCLEGDLPDQICEDALEKHCDDLGCDKNQIVHREPAEGNISVHIGRVASGNSVMKSGQHRDTIAGKEGVIGFEMEGAGVWDYIPCLIIKGVCDYADSHKNKLWQAYAAATAASAAKAFLEYWRPVQHQDARTDCHLMIPFERNPCFVGRQDEIHELEKMISTPGGAKKLAIIGLGGVGKTQVALELAYRMRDRDATCSIFWIPCTSYEAVEQAYMAIGQMVGIQDVSPADMKEHIKAYFRHKEGKWLLIFDNADDMEMWTKGSNNTLPLKDFLPFSNHGHIIFTSRNRELAVDLVSSCLVPIGELDEKTGIELLEKSLFRKDLLDDYPTTIALLEQLTFLPLAISQATAYINAKGITVSDYLMLLKEQEAVVVELLSKDFGDNGRYKDVQNPVAKTWLISFYQIQRQDELAAEYLSLMACFNPRNIPQSLLPQSGSRLKTIDALGLLNAYSFITIQTGNHFITLHRLVHLATRNWMRIQERFPAYISKAADRLSKKFPNDHPKHRQLWREYLPHALSLLNECDFREQQEKYIVCVQNVADCLYSDGRYNEAEELFMQVIVTWKQVLGPKHPATLTSMANLASTYRNQGRWKEAEELEVKIMETRKQVLRPEHPDILTSMASLATTYWNQGRWKEAEELEVQVIETRKQILGPEHPDTLTIMADLALTYRNQGRWKEAEELFIEILETRKQVLGPEHLHTLTSMADLASIYRNQGRWKKAEELEVQVIETRKQVLGPKHPHTLTSIANLASTYQNQGRQKEAEELLVQVIAIEKQVRGPEHPATLTSMANLASTYWYQGRLKEAEELEVHVLETQKQVLGPEHPDTLASMANLASTYQNQGRQKEAEELKVQVSETWKKVLGPEHPSTLTSMANLASIFQNQGRWKEAEELLVQVTVMQKQVLGPEHPDTLTSMANLASTYRNQGRWKEAEELEVQVLETQRQVLGPEHPHTLTSMANLASTYLNQGRWKEAEELEAQVLETRKQVLGPEHPSTLTSMANLASVYWNQDRWKEAEKLFIQVIVTEKQVLGPEHPSTLTSMANLASTYWNQGQQKEAEELEVQVLETQKQVLGPEHPDTLTSMANLATTYWNQGRWKEAEGLFVQALETQKQVLGPEHPSTLTNMANLACTWKSLGNIQAAFTLMGGCVELRSKVLGSNHPDTISSSNILRKWEAAHKTSQDHPTLPEHTQSPRLIDSVMVWSHNIRRVAFVAAITWFLLLYLLSPVWPL